MSNTFDAAPEGAHERSTASLEIADPKMLLEKLMEEANLHRGTLREQDGYTVPFREGGSVRIRVEEAQGDRAAALRFAVDAPTVERREYIEQAVSELALRELGTDEGALAWTGTE